VSQEAIQESINRGFCTIEHIFTMQNYGVLECLYNLFSQIELNEVIEIGTHSGGFTTMLSLAREKASKTFNITTYDIKHVDHIDEMSKKFNFNVIKEGIFKENFELSDFSKELFSKSKKCIFVDGGNKPVEFEQLSRYLLPGDIIGAHDYCKNSEVYEENKRNMKVWQWMEIQDSDVSEISEKYNLQQLPFKLSEQFENVAWLLKIKN